LAMSLGTILLIVLVLLLLGALPAWPYSTGWGYYPSGGLGIVLIVVLVLVIFGRVWQGVKTFGEQNSTRL
jgi:hypothetical protein